MMFRKRILSEKDIINVYERVLKECFDRGLDGLTKNNTLVTLRLIGALDRRKKQLEDKLK